MPVVVDNVFSKDTYGMRTERLIAIQTNFDLIQPDLSAPAEIATWAEDCYDVYANLLALSQLEANESEGATVVVSEKESALDEIYQYVKNMGLTIYKNMPKFIEDYGFEFTYPLRRDDKLACADKVILCYDRHVAALVTPLIPQVMITRLEDAKDEFKTAIGNQDKERSDARHAVANISEQFAKDTQKLNELKIWAYAMLGKQDPRMGLIGMVNPQSGGGSNVPAAPENITFYFPSTTFSISEVPGATSYILQASIDDGVTYFDVGSSPNPEIVYVPVQSGWMKYRAAGRSSAGIGEYSVPQRIGYYPGTVLPAPENLVLQLAAGSPNTLQLTFSEVASALRYSVNRSIVAVGAPSPGTFNFVTNVLTNEYIETVIPGNRFYYRLTAENSNQWSGVSETVFIDVPV